MGRSETNTRPNRKRLAIIGGGAAGMAAAITGARLGGEILLFEAQERPGKKLLATGNGRCNFGNLDEDPRRYHGGDPHFVDGALQAFPLRDNLAFFRGIGIPYREEEGKLYPYSGQAGAVLDALRLELQRLGVALLCQERILEAAKRGNRFTLRSESGVWQADKLIIAAGGMAAPQLGGVADGYALLEAFGHRRTRLFPALVQIKIDHPLPRALKGIKCKGKATLWREESPVATESGEILFTEYGLSGPPILQLSRQTGENPGGVITLDLLPEWEKPRLLSFLLERRGGLGHLGLEYFLIGIVNKKLGQLLIKHRLNTNLSRLAASLSDGELDAIADALKGFPLPVAGTLGWRHSQVTAGGIACDDFFSASLESRKTPGLFAAGEVLDVDGDCGGFNLQWAWSSGRLAATAAMLSHSSSGKQPQRSSFPAQR